MDADDKKKLKSLRKLRSCARPNSGREGVLADDVRELQRKCRANITNWGDELAGVNIQDLRVPQPPPAPDIKERLRKMLKNYMSEHRDARHVELKGLLRDAHQELGGGPPEPAEGALPAAPPPAALPPPAPPPALLAAHVEDPVVQARKQALKDRVWPLLPEAWRAREDQEQMAKWNPLNWRDRDLGDIERALDRKAALAGRQPAEAGVGGWPSLDPRHGQVKPACAKYKSEGDCVWPCAFKSGARDPNRKCRPASKAM